MEVGEGMEVGEPLHVAMTKWGERPHWEYDAVWLGTDDLGLWVGTPAGVRHHRPGLEFVSEVDTVTLFPRERWWAATFHAPGIWCTAYVDMATPAVLGSAADRTVVRAVDLDLDVIRRASGEWYVDDEDEFEEHQVLFGYPADIIEAADAARHEVWADVTTGAGAFDGRGEEWLATLRHLT